MKELTNYILKFGNLNKEQTDFIASKATMLVLPKDEYFLEAGKIPTQVAFLLDGIFRFSYYKNKKKKLQTTLLMKINLLQSIKSLMQMCQLQNICKQLRIAS